MLNPKEFMKKLKLIFYQLFNRKLPFVVFDCFNQEEGDIFPSWLFTNIKYETILAYDAKPDYFCADVMILDKEFTQEFYQLFPILKSTPCLIQAVDFISALSKASDITQCSLNLIHDEMILSYPDKNQIIDKVIGIRLLDIDVEMYKTVYNSGKYPNVLPYTRIFKSNELQADKFITEIYDGWTTEDHVPRKVRIIIQVGLTVPSLPLLLKNYKPIDDKESECEIKAGYDGDSVLVNSHYTNSLVCCNITQPAQRWFVRREPSRKDNQYAGEPETDQTQESDQETRTRQELGEEDTGSQGEAGSSEGKSSGNSACSGSCDTCTGTCKGREEGGATGV